MTCSVKIFSRTDRLLTELNNFHIGTRSWVLNGAGDCDLVVPRTDPKATEENFGQKNLVVIESDTGIPAWGGQVQEVDWSAPEWLKIRLRSKEILLRKHLGILAGTLRPGDVVQQLLSRLIVANELPGITPGAIYRGGGMYPYDIRAWDMYDKILPELIKSTEKDEPQEHEWFVDGHGVFHWTSGRGEDRSALVVLRSGYHLSKWPGYKLQYDKILTRALGLGNAVSWADTTKSYWTEPTAAARWGILEEAIDVPSNTVMRTEKYARRLVRRNWSPREMMDITINNRDGVWTQFWMGDIVRIVIPDFGWAERGGCDTKIRVVGIEVEEEVRKMRIIGTVFTPNVE